GHLVGRRGGVESPPEVVVLDRLPCGCRPPVRFPSVDPAGDAVAEIGAVGDDVEGRGAAQGLERGDGGHELHAVVGGHGLAALELARLEGAPAFAGEEERAPAAGAGVAGAGAVGIGEELRQVQATFSRRSRGTLNSTFSSAVSTSFSVTW